MRPRTEAGLPAAHALHLAELVARWNVSADQLFEGIALDRARLADADARLPLATAAALMARARVLTGEPGLAVYMGLQMRISAHGYLGFAAMTSSTVRGALEVATRFTPTRTDALALRLHEGGAHASLVLEELADLGELRDVVVLALAVGIVRIGEALTGRPIGGTADLAMPEPPYFQRFAHLFGDAVRFDQPAHQLVFDAAALDLPLVNADPAALKLAREQCERELDELGAGGQLVARVRAALPVQPAGFRSLAEIARALSMSPRTLKRKLAAQGTAFSTLLEHERRERALLLLRSAELSLDEIAARLGYSDLANFTRAFRRWTGQTPGAVRRSS